MQEREVVIISCWSIIWVTSVRRRFFGLSIESVFQHTWNCNVRRALVCEQQSMSVCLYVILPGFSLLINMFCTLCYQMILSGDNEDTGQADVLWWPSSHSVAFFVSFLEVFGLSLWIEVYSLERKITNHNCSRRYTDFFFLCFSKKIMSTSTEFGYTLPLQRV